MTEHTKQPEDSHPRSYGIANGSLSSKFLYSSLLIIPCAATLLYGAVDSAAIGLLAAASGLIASVWMISSLKNGVLCFNPNLIQLPIIGLIIIGLIQLLPLGGPEVPAEISSLNVSQALSLDPWATRIFLVRLIASLIFFAAALTYISSENRIRKTVFTIIVFGSLMAFFGILQRLALPDAIYGLRPTPQAIPFGPFVNQHHFAAFMELTGGLTLGLLFGGGVKKDKWPLLAIAGVIMTLAVVFTGSRGGFLSYAGVVVFAVAVSLVFRGRDRTRTTAHEGSNHVRRDLGIVGTSIFSILIVIGLVGFLGAGEGLLRGISGDTNVDPTSGRGHFWSVALQIFRDNPVLGAGLDAFGAAFGKYDTWNGMFRVEQAHNDYLQILADAGILGFACVATFIALLVRQGLAVLTRSNDQFYRSAAIGALAGCFGILIHSFFDFPLRTTSNGLFFLLLIAIVVAGGMTPERSSSSLKRSQ